jgi:hypothetical protein
VGLRIVVAACAVLLAYAPVAAAQPQTDARREIVGAVNLAAPASLAGAEVSMLRPTAGPQLGDAVACVQLANGAGFIAVFFEAAKVLNYRRAVAVDRCDGLVYEPLVAPAAAKTARAGSRKTSVQAIASPVPFDTDR